MKTDSNLLFTNMLDEMKTWRRSRHILLAQDQKTLDVITSDTLNFPGDDPNDYFGQLSAFATSKGFPVTRVPVIMDGPNQQNGPRTDSALGRTMGVKGLSSVTKIEILNTLSPAQQVATLAHELGHVLATQTDVLDAFRAAMTASEGQLECEAEAVSWCVSKALGIDASPHTFGYILGWAGPNGTPSKLDHYLRDEVTSATDEILDAVLVPFMVGA